MFTTAKRHGWLTSTLRFVPVIAIAAAAIIAMAPADARAQGFNVFQFECSITPLSVRVDLRGLGNTNICIEGSATIDANCACVNNGGNCPSDAKKQATTVEAESSEAVEPKNGRVVTTFTLDVTPDDSLCASGTNPLTTCPSGAQEPKLINFVVTDGADFTVCTTAEAAGEECSCDGAQILATELDCGPTEGTVFGGRRNSCVDLF